KCTIRSSAGIDVVAMSMAYIQLSSLGIPGEVVLGMHGFETAASPPLGLFNMHYTFQNGGKMTS
ncbi:hypothetical protein K5M55_09245, partial [Serratia marcescens]|nr:hypothetical protein [Serratia marcescens]